MDAPHQSRRTPFQQFIDNNPDTARVLYEKSVEVRHQEYLDAPKPELSDENKERLHNIMGALYDDPRIKEFMETLVLQVPAMPLYKHFKSGIAFVWDAAEDRVHLVDAMGVHFNTVPFYSPYCCRITEHLKKFEEFCKQWLKEHDIEL